MSTNLDLRNYSTIFVVPLSGTKIKVQEMVHNTMDKGRKRDDAADIVADIWGVSPRYVRAIRNGDRDNDEILCTITDYLEGKSKLIEEIKARIPVEERIKGKRHVHKPPPNDTQKGL